MSSLLLYYHTSSGETQTTRAILENDIVNKDKQEQRVRDDREGESLSESEHKQSDF